MLFNKIFNIYTSLIRPIKFRTSDSLQEIDGSERDSKIFFEIMVAFGRSKCMKLIRHSLTGGSFCRLAKTGPQTSSIKMRSPGLGVDLYPHQL